MPDDFIDNFHPGITHILRYFLEVLIGFGIAVVLALAVWGLMWFLHE